MVMTPEQLDEKRQQLAMFESWLNEWDEKPFKFFSKKDLIATIEEVRELLNGNGGQ